MLHGNLSIFERNVLHATRGAANLDADSAEEAEAIFLRWKDRNRLAAETCAYEWAEVYSVLRRMIEIAAEGFREREARAREVVPEVIAFLRERHERRYFPGH